MEEADDDAMDEGAGEGTSGPFKGGALGLSPTAGISGIPGAGRTVVRCDACHATFATLGNLQRHVDSSRVCRDFADASLLARRPHWTTVTRGGRQNHPAALRGWPLPFEDCRRCPFCSRQTPDMRRHLAASGACDRLMAVHVLFGGS